MNARQAASWLTPPPDYLWHWADDGSAAEWQGDATIALREELVALLGHLAPIGLPPLGSILAILMACSGKGPVVLSDAASLAARLGDGETPSAIRRLLIRVRRVTEAIGALPAAHRSGLAARSFLLRTLFEPVPHRRSPDESQAIVRAAESADPADLAAIATPDNPAARLFRDLRTVAAIHDHCDLSHLESLLRTGVDASPPAPAAVPDPDKEDRAGDSRTLLRHLAESGDADAAAIAAAARRVIAILALPRAAGLPQALPVGGFSDITNRGPLHRLLPGELAHDDLILSARLAHGEALFHQRESPPDAPAADRLILVDAGILLWGLPRLFAIAAALGLAAGTPPGESARVFIRRGAAFVLTPLDSPAAVLDAMADLSASSDPAPALTQFAPDSWTGRRPDVFFVGLPDHPPEVRAALHGLAERVAAADGRFCQVAVDRSGRLSLSRRTAAGTRLMAETRIDPDSLFTPASGNPEPPSLAEPAPPAVRMAAADQWPLPFRFPIAPTVSGRPLVLPEARIAVSQDRRLMRWDDRLPGAVEIAAGLPRRRSWQVFRHAASWVAVGWGPLPDHSVRIAVVDVRTGACRGCDLDTSQPLPDHVRVAHGAVILGFADGAEACSLDDGRRFDAIPLPPGTAFASIGFDGRRLRTDADFPPDEPVPPPPRHRLPAVMQTPLAAGFDASGRLVIRASSGRWELSLPLLAWKPTAKERLGAVRPFRLASPPDTSADAVHDDESAGAEPLRYVAEWHADCRLVFDARGILTIHAHDRAGPISVDILCLLDEPTAAWLGRGPDDERRLGAPTWLADPTGAVRAPVFLVPLLQRFAALAREAPAPAGAPLVRQDPSPAP